jgi:hypothetical protein
MERHAQIMEILPPAVAPACTFTNMATTTEAEINPLDIDPIWTTSRTARQIKALCEVDKVGHNLLEFSF